MTDLTQEDTIRLHVLIAECEAIRIDETNMRVVGLSGARERVVQLNPTAPGERYLRAVRELLSSQVIDSPGGYPVFLNRWSRMGQIDSSRLADLLKLGEPEAVIAVASSKGLTMSNARCAWWANPTTETARFLLHNDAVRESELGRELADHLIEYLPFETEPIHIANSVRLALLVDRLDSGAVLDLWRRGKRKTSILLGFAQSRPFSLPRNGRRAGPGNPLDSGGDSEASGYEPGDAMSRFLGEEARTLFDTLALVLKRPADQEIVVESLDTIERLLADIRPVQGVFETVEDIETRVEQTVTERGLLLGRDGDHTIAALWFLSLTGEPLVRDYFARSSTTGSLMRKQLAPILDPVCERLRIAAGAMRMNS
jgi:hypothetical protein